MELFVDSLLTKTLRITNSRNAKTLSPSHMKQCIMGEQRFDFLRELVKNVPDISVAEESATYNDEEDDQSSPEMMQHPPQTFHTTNTSAITCVNQGHQEIGESIPSTGTREISYDLSLPSTSNQAHKHHLNQQEYSLANKNLTNGSSGSHSLIMDGLQYTSCVTAMPLSIKEESFDPETECLNKNNINNNENPSTKVTKTRCSERKRNFNVIDKSLKRRNSNISDNNCVITKLSSSQSLKLKPAPILKMDYSHKPIIKIDYSDIAMATLNRNDSSENNSDSNYSSILRETKVVQFSTPLQNKNLSSENISGSINHTILQTASENTVLSTLTAPAKETPIKTDNDNEISTTNAITNDTNLVYYGTKVNLNTEELDEDYDDL